MLIDNKICDGQLSLAASNPRLRISFDLRTTPDDKSQRVLNALQPGTPIPRHRHRSTTETVIVLRGSMTEILYDDSGAECARYELNPDEGRYGVQIPVGMWHTVIVHEPTVIIEAKEGPYEPLTAEDTWVE